MLIHTKKSSPSSPPKRAAADITPERHPQHIVVELLNCRKIDKEMTLKELIEDVLDTINPPVRWSSSQVKSYQNYVVAALDNLYCAIQVRPKQSFYIDLYSDDAALDSRQVLTALKQELTPTEVRHRLINV